MVVPVELVEPEAKVGETWQISPELEASAAHYCMYTQATRCGFELANEVCGEAAIELCGEIMVAASAQPLVYAAKTTKSQTSYQLTIPILRARDLHLPQEIHDQSTARACHFLTRCAHRKPSHPYLRSLLNHRALDDPAKLVPRYPRQTFPSLAAFHAPKPNITIAP
jgi:hypothetical protein